MAYSVYTLTIIFVVDNNDRHISLEFTDDLGSVVEIANTISKLADGYSDGADVLYNPQNKPIFYGWFISEVYHYKKESEHYFFGVKATEDKGIVDYHFKKQYRVECEEYLNSLAK